LDKKEVKPCLIYFVDKFVEKNNIFLFFLLIYCLDTIFTLSIFLFFAGVVAFQGSDPRAYRLNQELFQLASPF
jgi:hypothetical protein